MRLVATIALLVLNLSSIAQELFFIGFTNKEHNKYSLTSPQQFLSTQAIKRRTQQGIAITEQDLPVSDRYIEAIEEQGAKVKYPLRWFNGAIAEIASSEQALQILALDFVAEVSQVYAPTSGAKDETQVEMQNPVKSRSEGDNRFNYGASEPQIAMLNGHKLHNIGLTGRGITIALLDAGYSNADVMSTFDSLRAYNRIVGTRDFVAPESNIYRQHYHGSLVLSVLAGLTDQQLIGSAPHANYWLIRTENANSEQLIEEYNWAAGAEFADSIGADIINSSLGYTQFDLSWQDHSYTDMNGITTPCSRAANIAASKGMVVVVSAGNEGDTPWRYISAPADAIGAITVGATTLNGSIAPFSSVGPSSDGRIKPDVAAQGLKTTVQDDAGEFTTTNGTSLSAPIISGLIACLWQSNPKSTATELIEAVKQSASISSNPNNSIGYGLPNFEKALDLIYIKEHPNRNSLEVYPNPAAQSIAMELPLPISGPVTLLLISATGATALNQQLTATNGSVTLSLPACCVSGLYLISVQYKNSLWTAKLIIK